MKKSIFLLLMIAICIPVLHSQKATPAKTKPALLVIDVQNAYLPYMDEKDKKLGPEMINYYIALFRDKNFPVIRVYNTDPKTGPQQGSESFEFATSINVTKDDAMIVKNYSNAFKKTELEKLLKSKGCNTLFLCGLSATGCVLATYFGATELEYTVFMLKDALISYDASLTKAVQEICNTIGYYSLDLLLKNIPN